MLTVPGTVLGRTAAGLQAGFAALALLVMVVEKVPGDGAFVRQSSGDEVRALAVVVDLLTGYAGVAVLTVLLVLLLARLGRRRDAVLCGVSVAGAMLGNALCKQLVRRARPELLPPDVEVSSFSFPSGHAAATAAVVVAALLTVRGTRVLLPAAAVGGLLVIGAAAAQLALALHHPSDIVGGWLWATAWTTAVWAAFGRQPAP
jgi:membrane-associated phospholipid phosphatase